MSRVKSDKEYKNVNCKIDVKIVEEFENICEETGLTKTKALERAMLAYIKKYKETGKA